MRAISLRHLRHLAIACPAVVVAIAGAAACSAPVEGAIEPAPSAASVRPLYEPAFVEGTPGSTCTLHPEGNLDPNGSIPATIDEDGFARFQAVRPTGPNSDERLSLDCVNPDGHETTYPVNLKSEATFAAHPFDVSRTNLEARAALVGDPLAFTESELIHAGYGLRPDPEGNPSGYARWLAAARVSAHKLRSVARTAPRSAAHSAPGRITADTSITSTPPALPGWTGAVMTGSYAKGATSALSLTYAANEANFTVPNITPGSYGIGGTFISIWNGLGQNAQQLVQNEVWAHTTWSAATYFIATQCFSAAPGQYSDVANGVTFTPSAGDSIFTEEWYCDQYGNVNMAGGYACTTMTDLTSGLVWTCNEAVSASCSSYKLNPADVANGIIGTSAEFIIENDDKEAGYTQGFWPQFTSPVAMTGTALVVSGSTTYTKWVGVDTDPYVNVLEDFMGPTAPDHISVSLQVPSRVNWNVTQAVAPAPPTAPGCFYSAVNTSIAGVVNVSPRCSYDPASDPITIFEQVGGAWQRVYSYPSSVSTQVFGDSPGFSVGGTPGQSLTFLGCTSPSSPDTWPIAPGDIGCDATPTTITVPTPSSAPVGGGGGGGSNNGNQCATASCGVKPHPLPM